MKLIVEVTEFKGEVEVYQYFKSDSEESRYTTLAQQAESVARLAEVAPEIEKTVSAYYSQDKALMPKVLKKSDKEPVME